MTTPILQPLKLQQISDLRPVAAPGVKQNPLKPWAKKSPPTASALTEPPPTFKDIVLANLDTILMRWVQLESFDDIGATLKPIPLTGAQLRMELFKDHKIRARFQACYDQRVQELIERAVASTVKADKAGDHAQAAALFLKVAEKMAPDAYGPTMRLMGNQADQQQPVKPMTPEEAYKAMIRGEAIDVEAREVSA